MRTCADCGREIGDDYVVCGRCLARRRERIAAQKALEIPPRPDSDASTRRYVSRNEQQRAKARRQRTQRFK